MELIRSFCASHGVTLDTYMSLQRALMRRFIAQGGTAEEFCKRLAPAFRRKYGSLLDEGEALPKAA